MAAAAGDSRKPTSAAISAGWDKLTQQGLLLTPGSIDDFVKFQRDDMAQSAKIIQDGKIRAD